MGYDDARRRTRGMLMLGLHRLSRGWALPSLVVALAAACSAVAQEPEQVVVSVKVIEFQTTKGVETGLSAFFTKVSRARPFGEVSTSGSLVNTVDLTFPTSTAAGITVFLDRLSFAEGELEIVLQALVDENRAFILSKPHAMVMVGATTPTVVQTTQGIPYENTVVVGNTTARVTAYQDTGVSLSLNVPQVKNDDGNLNTRDDNYVHLQVDARVQEEGQRIAIKLDDQLAGGGDFSLATNAILVPEFISRSITTQVWVREGQVLMLGGLYRNTESKNIATLPWLTQAEDAAVGFVNNVVSGRFGGSPISATFGSRDTKEARRELVFLIKAEFWRPSFTIPGDLGFEEQQQSKRQRPPAEVITTVSDEPPDSGVRPSEADGEVDGEGN